MALEDGEKVNSLGSIDVDCYRVKAGEAVNLAQMDPRDTGNFEGDKGDGEELLKSLSDQLAKRQELFYAQGKHRLLVVLQAMDTGGKDSTISHVFSKVNPLGVNVANFKAPTGKELTHDYLWRIHPHTPGNGEMVIFNRSHYEEVLIVRVHQLVATEVWSRRYEHINCFEKMLADEGTTILKFFLHVSKEEQKKRLQERLDKPSKRWKFAAEDLVERKLWDDYIAAYEDVLRLTSMDYAPWYIVPADRKWYRNLVVAKTIVQTLDGLKLSYPTPNLSLDKIVID